MTRPLEGRAAIVTGASQGLGLEITRAFVDAGASVMMCARDAAVLEESRKEIAGAAGAGQLVVAHAGDVSREDEAAGIVKDALERFSRLDILVNNAGVYGPMGAIDEIEWAGWVRAIEINLLGSVLMSRAVIGYFKAQRAGKIIQLSGGGATNPLPRISVYRASKAAIVRFAETLAEEVKDEGIDVNAIAPGALNTRLLDEAIAAGPERTGRAFYDRSVEQKQQGGAPPERAAALAVFLASPASDGITGKLFSAIWDPWETLASHREELRRSDVYTLRRILPRDRGLDWDESSAPPPAADKPNR